MSSIDFDEVLVHVGEKGRYQNIMYYLLCIPATLPAAFLAFSQVSTPVPLRKYYSTVVLLRLEIATEIQISRRISTENQAANAIFVFWPQNV